MINKILKIVHYFLKKDSHCYRRMSYSSAIVIYSEKN